MVASGTGAVLEELAQALFDTLTQFCLSVPRARRRAGDLKELEFLTLSILHHHDTLIVGDIQRQLGVLPAQMSRIIRALETRERPLIACRINPQDRPPAQRRRPAGQAARGRPRRPQPPARQGPRPARLTAAGALSAFVGQVANLPLTHGRLATCPTNQPMAAKSKVLP